MHTQGAASRAAQVAAAVEAWPLLQGTMQRLQHMSPGRGRTGVKRAHKGVGLRAQLQRQGPCPVYQEGTSLTWTVSCWLRQAWATWTTWPAPWAQAALAVAGEQQAFRVQFRA